MVKNDVCVQAGGLEKQLTWVGRAARTEWWRMGKGSGAGNEGRWHLRQVLLVMWHYQGPLLLFLLMQPLTRQRHRPRQCGVAAENPGRAVSACLLLC